MPFHGLDRPGGCGLPSTDRLSGFVSAGNGKIQGGPRSTPRRVMTRERIAARGFLVLPKRFVVERAVAWLNRCRRRGGTGNDSTDERAVSYSSPPSGSWCAGYAAARCDSKQALTTPGRSCGTANRNPASGPIKGFAYRFRIGADVGYRGWRSCSDPSRRTSGHPAPPQEEHIDGETDGLIAQNDGRPNRHAGHAC
jgi:hypothetical protein